MTYTNNTLTRAKLPIVDPHPEIVMDVQAVAPPRHPVGLNVRQDVNYADVLAYVKQMGGVRTILFHCDRSVLPKLRPFLEWCDVVIWRPREYVSERLYLDVTPMKFNAACYNALRDAGFHQRDIWVHLHNESGWNAQAIEWERQVIEIGVPQLMKFVALSPAVGTPEQTAIPMARPIIELAGKFPDNILLGCHEYFSIYGTRKDPWYLERWQFWEQYRIAEGLPGVRYVITEFGSEDIADDHPFTNTLPRTGKRTHVGPVKANDRAWANTYHVPAINFHPRKYTGLDSAYADQITMAVDVGQYLDPRIVGLCLFTWGNREDRWVDYDVSDMTAMHTLLAKWWKDEQVIVPPVVPPPMEVSPVKRGKLKRASNLRKTYGTHLDNPPIELLPIGHEMEYIERTPPQFANSNYWIEVNTTRGNGERVEGYWIALTGANHATNEQFEPLSDVEPPPPPATNVTHVEMDAALNLLEARWQLRYEALRLELIGILADAIKREAAASALTIEDLKTKLPKAS